jgi:hypothetical protein
VPVVPQAVALQALHADQLPTQFTGVVGVSKASDDALILQCHNHQDRESFNAVADRVSTLAAEEHSIRAYSDCPFDIAPQRC